MTAQTSYTDTPAVGLPGGFADARDHQVVSRVNTESSAAIPPGVHVTRGTDPRDVKLPTAAADITTNKGQGTTLRRSTQINRNLITNAARDSYQPGDMLPVGYRGAFFVTCESSFTAGGQVYARFKVRGANTQLGAYRGTVDNGAPDGGGAAEDHAAAVPTARFENSGSAGELAIIRVDILPAS